MPIDSDHFRALLLDTKAALEKRVNTIHDHARNPLNADSAEQAAELGNVEVVSALEKEALKELADIDGALKRLTEGTFGFCTSCSEEIGIKRLSARPASAECLDCAELAG